MRSPYPSCSSRTPAWPPFHDREWSVTIGAFLLNGAPHRIFGLLLRLERFSFLSWGERTCATRSPLRG